VQELERAVKRFFFLHADRTKKVGDKITHYTHAEEKERVINAIGYEKWERTGQAETFGDIPAPVCFSELFNIFIDIFYFSQNGITYSDIAAYSEANKRELSAYEVRLIRIMAGWAAHEINKANRESL